MIRLGRYPRKGYVSSTRHKVSIPGLKRERRKMWRLGYNTSRIFKNRLNGQRVLSFKYWK